MALSANTVAQLRTDGDDNNGGGFITGASGTDYSTQTSAQATLTTASIVHTTTTQITVDGGDYTVAAGDVGNLLNITGGTATAGWYEITAVDTGNNRWTLDRSAGTSTQTLVAKMGGALASFGRFGELHAAQGLAGWKCYCKSGTYTAMTTATQNVAGGALLISSVNFIMESYLTTPGDGEDQATWPEAVMDAGAVTSIGYMISATTGYGVETKFVGVKCDGQGGSGNNGFTGTGNYNAVTFMYCTAFDLVTGFSVRCKVIGCVADTCTSGYTGVIVAYSFAVSCTSGFKMTSDSRWFMCVAYGCTDGFIYFGTAYSISVINCASINNTSDGFDMGSSQSQLLCNCIAWNNTGTGFKTGTQGISLNYCAAGDNGTDYSNTQKTHPGAVDLTADPFTDSASYDFSLNSAAGGGALCKAAGILMPSNVKPDLGGVWPTPAAGGGGLLRVGMSGGVFG